MATTHLLWAVLFSAMFLGADGTIAGSLPDKELQERCQANKTAIFAHPGECQLYYNCSNDFKPHPLARNPMTQYMMECPHPLLFSTAKSGCADFDDVTCGNRKEPFDCGDYYNNRCYSSHCIPCSVFTPSCRGLPDGINVHTGREYSPYYAVCRSQRSVSTGSCPRHKSLQMTQLFHPQKRRCVSLYEIPKAHSGLAFNCTNKEDGLHLDDVTDRPDVYYQCQGKELVNVERCQGGTYFDELLFMCAEKPLKNRIFLPHCEGGQADGINVYVHREWSPYYAVCQSGRLVSTGTCPKHPVLDITQLFHAQKRRCVSVYEVPRAHSTLSINCTNKANGLHLDDVTNRPDVYYKCHGEQLVDVDRCEDGTYFDELLFLCAEKPLKNRVTNP